MKTLACFFQDSQLCSQSAGQQSRVHIQGLAAGGVALRYIQRYNEYVYMYMYTCACITFEKHIHNLEWYVCYSHASKSVPTANRWRCCLKCQLAECLAGWLACWPACGWLAGWLAAWLTGGLAVQLAGLLAGRAACWLASLLAWLADLLAGVLPGWLAHLDNEVEEKVVSS